MTRWWLAIAIALVPAGVLAWQGRDLPQFGQSQDDGIYLLAGRSLAREGEYRMPHLPGNPPQTKYPPLYPALLSLAWVGGQEWPGNRATALLLTWIWLPAAVTLSFPYFRRLGWSPSRAALLAMLVAAHPVGALIACQLNADTLFTFLVLLTVVLAGRARSLPMVGALALAATAACLTKTAGLALVIGVAGYLLWQRRTWHAAAFASLPLLVLAMARQSQHVSASPDLLYYLDYLRYYRLTVHLGDVAALLQTNLEALLAGLGGLIATGPPHEFALRLLRYWAAAMAIRGGLRLAGQPAAQPYLAFAACYLPMLLVWNFVPNERFLLPLLPLALAGMAEELRFLLGQRPVWLAGPALICAWCAVETYGETYRVMRAHREHAAAESVLLQAITAHVPPEQGILAHYDTLVHLNSGRPAVRPVLDPMLLYHRRRDAAIQHVSDTAPVVAKSLGLRFVLWTTRDYSAEFRDDELDRIEVALSRHPGLRLIRATGAGALYEVLDYGRHDRAQTR